MVGVGTRSTRATLSTRVSNELHFLFVPSLGYDLTILPFLSLRQTVLHALGFWHEHSRPDRDDYITIQWDNIVAGAEDNFEKAAAVAVNSLGSPYDFNSIMHYTSNGFSIDSNLDTIVEKEPLESWEKMGQRMRLSVNDINQLRLLYQCKSGPRGGNVGVYDLCSTDCKCWENALGECSSDDECMGDLVCRDTPSPLPVHEYLDVLPQFPFASGTITCSSYCHSLCCQFPDNVVACPETCGTAPPPEEVTVVPSKMCIADDGSSGTTTSGTSGTGATSAGTTTIATTTATTSNNAKWYIDWSISKVSFFEICCSSDVIIFNQCARVKWNLIVPPHSVFKAAVDQLRVVALASMLPFTTQCSNAALLTCIGWTFHFATLFQRCQQLLSRARCQHPNLHRFLRSSQYQAGENSHVFCI